MYVGIPRFVSLVFIAVNISFVVAPSMDYSPDRIRPQFPF